MSYRLFVVAAWVLLSSACGPSITVYPLVNEDPSVVAKHCARPDLDPDDADVKAVKAFLAACRGDDVEMIWGMLSTRTRTLFDNLGKVRDRAGIDLLREQRFPSLANNRVDVERSALALFFFEGEVELERAPGGSRLAFLVVDERNRYKPVRLVEEEGAYRVDVEDLKRYLQ
jgi:hypothetical protein